MPRRKTVQDEIAFAEKDMSQLAKKEASQLAQYENSRRNNINATDHEGEKPDPVPIDLGVMKPPTLQEQIQMFLRHSPYSLEDYREAMYGSDEDDDDLEDEDDLADVISIWTDKGLVAQKMEDVRPEQDEKKVDIPETPSEGAGEAQASE